MNHYSLFDSDNFFPGEHDQSESRARTALWIIAGLLAVCVIMRIMLALVEGGAI